MPQAVNIVVNNATAVSKTFALISPAAGDGGVAMWALREGTISSVFPTVTASAARTNNSSRKLQMKIRLPSSYSDSVTGRTAVASAAEANIAISMPGDYPEALKADFVAYVTNVLATPLAKEMMRDALSAT